MARIGRDGKQGHWQLDSSRSLSTCICAACRLRPLPSLSKPGRIYPHLYHHTGSCQDLTLQVCVSLEANAMSRYTPNDISLPTAPDDMDDPLFQQRTLVSLGTRCVLAKVIFPLVLGTASMCISMMPGKGYHYGWLGCPLGHISTKSIGVPRLNSLVLTPTSTHRISQGLHLGVLVLETLSGNRVVDFIDMMGTRGGR